MCGISAVFSTSSVEMNHYITAISKKTMHRGDNDTIYSFFKNCALSCNRLAILDIENGEQPLFNEDRTIGVVFNGEIYNYLYLKIELEKKGHHFSSDCDTEVLVHLYEERGESFFEDLDGMFAFILFDSVNNYIIAVRDYYGVKPLYYGKNDKSYFFSSEIKGLVELPIEEIYELPNGSYFKNGNIYNYYNKQYFINYDSNFEDSVKIIRELVEKAVYKRVQTDLPVGILFGGGLDSSIVLLLALKYNKNVTPLIIGYENAQDVIIAKRFCNEFNIKYIYYKMEETEIDLIKLIPEIVITTESFEPNVIRASILSYLICKHAKNNNFKLLLCGEGSDEIFAGYGDFLDENDTEVYETTLNLFNDLHRTQLQRVDRTSMAHAIEVREPFLDRELVEFALTIPPIFKVHENNFNHKTTKFILREAFKDLLPKYIYYREKMTFMEGAGLGEVNKDKGRLYSMINQHMNDDDFNKIQNNYPQYNIQNKEEAFYLDIFLKYYEKAKFCIKRPHHALKEIVQKND